MVRITDRLCLEPRDNGSRPLRVLVVLGDRAELRRISKFLGLVGYSVRQTTDARQARAAVAIERPDFLLLDARLDAEGGRELIRELCGQEGPSYVYTVVLGSSIDAQALMEAVEAGVDDCLTAPVVFGEVLARLRAGARVLEFERRTRAQDGMDSRIPVLNVHGFIERLKRARSEGGRLGAVACAVVDLDLFSVVNHRLGWAAGDDILRKTADQLLEECTAGQCVGRLRGDRFAVLLPGLGESQALEWVDGWRQKLEALNLVSSIDGFRLTASAGVAEQQKSDLTLDEVLSRAEGAAQLAKRAGRNCVATGTELVGESKSWSELAAAGRLFESTVARDVMAPATVIFDAELPAAAAVNLLRRTRHAAAPVVSSQGKLQGLATQEQLAAAGDGNVAKATTPAPRFDEEATFRELISYFTDHSDPLAVVVRGDRPTGVITRESLVSLSEPLTDRSFEPQQPYSDTSDYLLVTSVPMGRETSSV